MKHLNMIDMSNPLCVFHRNIGISFLRGGGWGGVEMGLQSQKDHGDERRPS